LVIGFTIFVWHSFSSFDIKKYPIRGIDISHHNNIYNWNSIRQVNVFCIMKASEGKNFDDNRFNYNWQKAAQNNLIRGAYHFFVPNISAEKQFENFRNSVTLKAGDLPPILDVEMKKCNIDEVNKWLKLAESYYGVKPIIYSDYYFFMTFMYGRVDNYPLWLVNDYKIKFKPTFLNYDCIFLQYNQNGKVNGINGPVDLDVFIGDKNELKKLLIK
jgi:lysozyme